MATLALIMLCAALVIGGRSARRAEQANNQTRDLLVSCPIVSNGARSWAMFSFVAVRAAVVIVVAGCVQAVNLIGSSIVFGFVRLAAVLAARVEARACLRKFARTQVGAEISGLDSINKIKTRARTHKCNDTVSHGASGSSRARRFVARAMNQFAKLDT